MTIDRWSREPSYQQLANLLRARIVAGELPPGATIPSEKSLMQEYDLARETVRHAVRVLRDEGLIVTVPGRGSYVTPE